MKIPLRSLVLWLAAPLLIGVAGLLLGQDANWDFRNYHYYNGYAFLTGRLGFDILPANHPSYYNPLLDAGVFWLMQHLPAWLVSLLLGTFQGLSAPLLYRLALTVAPPAPGRHLLAAILAAAGCTGALAVSEIGATFHDNTLTVPVLAGLLLVLQALAREARGRALGLAVGAAALLIGAACGLKLTMSLYAVGLATALVLALPLRRLAMALAVAGGAGLAGMLLTGGYWSWVLWSRFHNPMFPHFNNLFHSIFAGDTAYRDMKFIEKLGPLERIFLPFFSTFDSWRVAESDFLDARLLAAFAVCLPALFFLRRASPAQRALIGFAAAAYVVWVWLYCIYRYVLPLEMLAPVLVLAGLMALHLPHPTRLAAAIAVALALATAYPKTLEPERIGFADRFVVVKDIPALAPDTLVAMAGDHPTAFMIPAFPATIRFVRINDWPFLGQSDDKGFAPLIRRTIADHDGPIMVLTDPEEIARARAIAKLFGLRLGEDCNTLLTNLTAERFLLCPARRIGAT